MTGEKAFRKVHSPVLLYVSKYGTGTAKTSYPLQTISPARFGRASDETQKTELDLDPIPNHHRHTK